MKFEIIEERFYSYLEKYSELSEVSPFILTYIQLLLLFKNELSPEELIVVLERQKQMRGEVFDNKGFHEIKSSSRKMMDSDLSKNTSSTRKAMLNRLLFCILLDTEENDFFYLVEPIFEFVKIMGVSLNQLTQILELEFVGFKINLI